MATDLFEIIRERRGWTETHLSEINDPSHEQLLGMDEMVEHLHRFKTSGAKLVVVPDFDMDGITSGTIGLAGLSELGFNVRLYRPDYNHGHGVTPTDIDSVLKQFDDVEGVITCDVGITAHAGINHAINKGLTVLVTDHHKETEGRSRAHAIVNPARYDETYRLEAICGAHVLYQVLHAYATKHAPGKVPAIELLKLFAGIGTVSDVMPLVYENRQLVKDSVSLARLLYVPADPEAHEGEIADIERSTLMLLLRGERHHPLFIAAFEGFATTLAVFQDTGKLRSIQDISVGFYGFYLAPAFNAIRRIGGDIENGFGAFFGQDKRRCIENLIADNEYRKQMVIEYVDQMDERDQPYAPEVYLTDAPAGMLGLLANKILSRTGRPTIVMHDTTETPGPVGGSARSPGWYPLNTNVNQAGFIAQGHEHACGVRVRSAQDLPTLVEYLRTSIDSTYQQLLTSGELAAGDTPDLLLGNIPESDGSLDDTDEILDLVERIDIVGPYGHGFESPSIEIAIDLSECWIKTLGSDKQHLSIVLPNGLKCLWWNQAHHLLELRERKESVIPGQGRLNLRGHFEINIFRGVVSPNFFIDRLAMGYTLGEED